MFASDNGTVSLVFHDDCVYAYDRIGHTGAVESKDTDKVVIVKAELEMERQLKCSHMRSEQRY